MTHPGSPDHGDLVAGNTAFAIDLYQQLCMQEGNLFFSPYSISTALAMAYAGARGNTETEMARVLHFAPSQEELHPAFAVLEARLAQAQARGDVVLHGANALWPQTGYTFLPAFLDLCQRCYGVDITAVDYAADPEAARQQINAWGEAQTRGKIKDLVPPDTLDVLTRLVLTNAVYFKGNWASQFDKAHTHDAPFAVQPGLEIVVPMMAQRLECGYGEVEGVQVLELPYAGDTLSMVVLLETSDAYSTQRGAKPLLAMG